jgi:type IX secretion system PorP/SprF family membrane protein
MRFIITFIAITLLPWLALAQQKSYYSQYMANNYLLNPAITGIEDYTDISLGSRKQWVGIEGSPFTTYVSVHHKLGGSVSRGGRQEASQKTSSFGSNSSRYNRSSAASRHGIGAIVVHDRIGPFSRTEASLSYAFHLPLSSDIKVASGVSAGLIQQSVNPDKLNFRDADDPADVGWNMFKPNLALGFWLYGSDFYIGASGTQLFANTVNFDNIIDENNELYNHYFLTAAYKFDVSYMVSIIPSVMTKWTQPSPGTIDYNLKVIYDQRMWGGVSFRQHDSFAVMAGISINPAWGVSYSYDYGINSIGRNSSGSHEVVLSARLFNSQRVLCPQNMW